MPRRPRIKLLLTLPLVFLCANWAGAQRIAVVFPENSALDKTLFEVVSDNFPVQAIMLDGDMTQAAFRARKFDNPFNLSLEEARDLTTAIGCDRLVLARAATLRRSSSKRDVYYESYASLFLVSAENGNLTAFRHFAHESDTPEEAELAVKKELPIQLNALLAEKQNLPDSASIRVGDLVEIGDEQRSDLRTPLPYRQLTPPPSELAGRFFIEAVVDAQVTISREGRVTAVHITKWAGYGLDESVVETVKKMSFRPALKDGKPVPARFTLRYNFRVPRKAPIAQ
jgi:TonB family protein